MFELLSIALGALACCFLVLFILAKRKEGLLKTKVVVYEEKLQVLLQNKMTLEDSVAVSNTQILNLTQENTELKAILHHERVLAQSKIDTLQQLQNQVNETFQNLSKQALLANNSSFMELAKSSFHHLLETSKLEMEKKQKQFVDVVEPVHKTLTLVDQKIAQLEKERVQSFTDLRRQLVDLTSSQKDLRLETANLVKALRTPTGRGQWGEIQLKRVVEMAGMLAHCDFTEQTTSADGKLRPDLVVHIPGDKQIVVDAKTPLSAYLEALEIQDEDKRTALLDDHARQVRAHVRALSQRGYWEQFQPSPEFVVMFLPGEAFFSAALERDPSLIEYGVKEKVILATPTTLIALLRAVSFGWRQENIADHAKVISELGRELYKRLNDMTQHFSKMGRHVHQMVDSYNQTVASFERRVLVTARKFQDIDSTLPTQAMDGLVQLEATPRSIEKMGESDEKSKLSET